MAINHYSNATLASNVSRPHVLLMADTLAVLVSEARKGKYSLIKDLCSEGMFKMFLFFIFIVRNNFYRRSASVGWSFKNSSKQHAPDKGEYIID